MDQAGKGRWTMGPPVTLRFSSIAEAMLYSRQERLQGMEVVLLHSDSFHKVVVPIGLTALGPEHSNYGQSRARAA